jgi:cytochrome c-type biogenesis protein CcmH
MLVFFAAAILLSALFVGLLARPLVRTAKAEVADVGAANALRQRLDEIERDRSAALLEDLTAREAAQEAKRSALAAPPAPAPTLSKPLRLVALAIVGSAPLAAAWIYSAIGAPDLASMSRAETAAMSPPSDPSSLAPVQRLAMIEGMVRNLASRLVENPEDPDGWRMLARSYAVLGKSKESADAWRELLKRVEGAEDDWQSYAEQLLAAGAQSGRAEEFNRVMTRLLEINPSEPMALYFAGAQANALNDSQKAADYWRRLLAVLPQDAPVRPAIEQLIAETKKPTETAPK